ncbi:isoprenoid synthase domain-containing protein [Scheffersomyces coipomensis]|uniref:isoprenoid synthase domain-containing protein n=1 Tax=Scheffersomyces coipomensis TaxID=1788519 RepID=UPI00315C8F29
MSKKIVDLLTHPTELRSVIQLFYFRQPLHIPPPQSENLKRCYYILNWTSRSFVAVIQELHPELRDVISIFYLVLRALDTVEDDMTLDPAVKIPLLRTFYEKLDLEAWNFDGSGPNEKDRIVLVEFDKVLIEYHNLKPEYQEVIKDITEKMGNGMADYILDENFNLNGVATIKDYDLYCHYVAGLVGEGLTKLMYLAKFSDKATIEDNFVKSNSMGLFLQKTNIIRDYNEDLEDGRSFWPKEIWSKYTDKLPSFRDDTSPESEFQGLSCINDLVLNTLDHAKDVLRFLALVKDPSTFNFCAIPQVMAVATLAEVYNNPNIFHKVVKIRKGTTCQLMLESRTYPGVVRIFRKYIQIINHKSNVKDPNYFKIGIKCGEIEQFCESLYPDVKSLPKGLTPAVNELTDVLKVRESIDKSMQRRSDQELFNTNVTILAILTITFGILYKLVY